MNVHALLVTQPIKMLNNLAGWLDKATAYAQERKFDANNLLQSRLFPDQFPLVRQIQSACDSAKGNAGRLAGKELPSHPDTETSIELLKARIATCVAFLESIKEDDFKDLAGQKISMSWMQGKHFKGDEYLQQFAVPNFYFHVTTSYAILRHNGVPLGKLDFLGSIPMYE